MPSQTYPTVFHGLSPLERCSPEILERIVLFAIEGRLIGPPSDLLALLTTSKTINFALSPRNNNQLYAKIFAFKFDTAAASRRLTPRYLTSKSLATELRLRFEALNRIRSGAVDGYMLEYDLWTVFFILLEHDRKNALQLTEWAKTHTFANLVAERWLTDRYGPDFSENVGGLVCTIIWELVREAELTESWRRRLRDLLYTHLICGYRFSSFYASEEFFVVRGHDEDSIRRVQGRPPAHTQAQYYGHTITVAAPPLAPACLSVFMLAMLPNTLRYTPGYMREYIPGRTFSERMDDEWHRLVMCHSITAPSNPLGGRRFTPSSLIGSWKGAVLVPNLSAFSSFLHSNQRENPLNISIGFFDAEMELQEHHCLGDEIGLTAGPGLDKISDDPLNAWIPHGTTFDEDNGELKIYDPIASCERVYQTYLTDSENPYASGFVQGPYLSSDDRVNPEEDKLAQLAAQITNKEPESHPDETQGLVNNPSYIDNDDQWEGAVEHLSSGIRDIVITGKMKTGDHEHSLVGRIRGWDGLIILARSPSSPNDPPDFNWVFRGYVHGERRIVGRWKQALTPVGAIGWEGGFMFTKDM